MRAGLQEEVVSPVLNRINEPVWLAWRPALPPDGSWARTNVGTKGRVPAKSPPAPNFSFGV